MGEKDSFVGKNNSLLARQKDASLLRQVEWVASPTSQEAGSFHGFIVCCRHDCPGRCLLSRSRSALERSHSRFRLLAIGEPLYGCFALASLPAANSRHVRLVLVHAERDRSVQS